MNKQHYNNLVKLLSNKGYVDGATDYCLLLPYAKQFNLDIEERLWLAYLYGLSYSTSTAIRIQQEFATIAEVNPKALKTFWEKSKDTLYFNRDKRYIKNNDQVIPAIKSLYKLVKGNFESYLPVGFQPLYQEILKNWKYFGQMGAYLFFDALYGLCPKLYVDADTLDWSNCSKPVRECAALVMEVENTSTNFKELDRLVKALKENTNQPVIFIESVLCAYYKMLKGTRYFGFYADRLLEEVTEYQEYMPDGVNLWSYRQKTIPKQLRGEYKHRWSGIRKDCCVPLKLKTPKPKSSKNPQQLLINIRGANGAGKSTALIQMRESDPEMFEVVKPVEGKPKIIATVYPSYNIVALGKYSNKCGGVDSFKGNEMVEKALKYIIKTYPTYTIVMEGIIVSTIYQTYADLFTNLKVKHGLNTKILFLMPTLDVCLKRVCQRNGGKVIKEDSVAQKYRTMERGISKFKADGFSVDVVDNSNWAKEDTLDNFLSLIEKYKEELI